MMMKRVLLLAAAMSLAACTVAPYKQPLDAKTAGKLREAPVYAKVDDRGFGVQYLGQDAAGGAPLALAAAPVGVVGAVVGTLVAEAMDAGANVGLIALSQDRASKLSTAFRYDQASARFNELMLTQLGQTSLFSTPPTLQSLDQERKWAANEFSEPTVLVTGVEYSMTRDLRSLEVVLTATVLSKDAVKLRSRGVRKGMPDEGIIYRNRFEYHSAPLEGFVEKTQQQIDAEVERVKARFKARENDPRSLTTGERAKMMKKEMAQARGPTPMDVQAEFYLKLWLANDGVLLRDELQAGLVTVAELLARDLQDSRPVDQPDAVARTTVVPGDKRIVSRVDSYPFKGSLISEPVGYARPGSNGVAHPREENAEPAAVPAAGQ